MSLTSMPNNICAIVVAYRPDLALLGQQLQSLIPQVGKVIIVDNSANPHHLDGLLKSYPALIMIDLGGNAGVAAALNTGVERARSEGFSHVLLMDQDSVPAADMVSQLAAARTVLTVEGNRLATVGPRLFDPRIGKTHAFIKRRGWRIHRVGAEPGGAVQFVESDYLVTSGSLLSIRVYDEVGPYDEGMFIDYVDTDWQLRAKALGYISYGICAARLDHMISEGYRAVWLGRKRFVPVHSPLRHYYFCRNALLLYRRPHAPWPWIVNDACRLLLRYMYHSTVTSPRFQHFAMMTLGFWHGLRGLTGAY